MRGLSGSKPVYVLAYLAWMIPTYVLPYFGSNSTIVTAISAGLGRGLTPQWWAHLWCLSMLILLSHARGVRTGKSYLAVFSFLASVFDMTPGLNVIPMVPTMLHLLAVVLGLTGHAKTDDGSGASGSSGQAGTIAVVLSAVAAMGGIYSSMAWMTGGRQLPQLANGGQPGRPSAPMLAKDPTTDHPSQPQVTVPQKRSVDSASKATPPTKVAAERPVRPTVPLPSGQAGPTHTRVVKSPEPAPPPRVRYINLNE